MKLSDILVGTAALVVLRLFLASGGLRASLRSSFFAAVVGAVAYPLFVYASTGIVAATRFPDRDGWPGFEFGFARFAQSAPAESIPSGVMIGVLVMACVDLFKRRSKSVTPIDHPGRQAGDDRHLQDAREHAWTPE